MDKKQYNKTYYEKHKQEISNKLCCKVVCNLCGRTVIKNNIQSHKKREICKRTIEQKIRESEILKQMNNNVDIFL